MAEAIILPLATSILKKIASFAGDHVMDNVTEEIKGFKSVKEDLKSMAKDLESITAVLQDAEAKQYSNAAMKIWLRGLKSVVYDIDDLLDEVATDALQRSLNKSHLLPRLGYYLSFKSLTSRIDLSHKIKNLQLELKHVVAKKNDFGLTERPIEAPSVERNVFDAFGHVNKFDIVGRDEAKNTILNRVLGLARAANPPSRRKTFKILIKSLVFLTHPLRNLRPPFTKILASALGLRAECSLSILPILGMGGIGKTALAKLVYGEIDQFDIKIWVCVSHKFDFQKILEDVLKGAISENTSNYSCDTLVNKVREVLNGKKYFLVLDDLWEDDINLWTQLKNILDVGRCGSVILITTRIERVASNTQNVERYNLNKLPDSVCWCIFKKLAFAEGEEERYPKLVEIGKSIVEKCCGIPLVVQCLGSLLRGESDEREWLRIKNMDNLNQLDGRYATVKQLLKLSYDKLPSHIKPLFAHLSLHAKDTEYYSAFQSYYYGALQLHNESYSNYNAFNEMVSRSMLQDASQYFNNAISSFKVHDLLHDIASDVLGEDLFIVTKNDDSVPNSSRYIAWESKELFPIKAKKARAFTFRYIMRSVISHNFLKGIISNMPCLRILDLYGSQFEELPSSIGDLKHLRFLSLSNNHLIKSLPNTLCELLNLECLCLNGCKQLEELPSKMCKLINLKVFWLTTRQRSLVDNKLNRLPCLWDMEVSECMELVSLWENDDVGRLTCIRKLSIADCPKLTSIPNSMKHLEELWIVKCEELDLVGEDALTGLDSLRSLYISGIPRLTCLPQGMHSAASSLKYLYIKDCRGLRELPNWLQSFASLEKLIIQNCSNLLSLPQGIRHLNSLEHLAIYNCPHLTRRCEAPGGEDLSLIRHVPEIWIDGRRLPPNQQ